MGWGSDPFVDDASATATVAGGWGKDPFVSDAPEPEKPAAPDFSDMYARMRETSDEATRQGVSAYDLNLKRAADWEQESRGAIRGSKLYRGAEDAVKATADAFVTPLLMAEDAAGIDAAGELLATRQASREIDSMRDQSYVERMANGIVQSIGKVGALAATGGGLPALVASFGSTSYADSKRQAIKEGKTEEEATKIARANAAVETAVMMAFNLVGLGGMEGSFLKQSGWQGVKQFAKQTAAELTEEQLTTLGQELASKGNANDPQAFIDTAVQTIGTMGLVGGAQRITNFVNNPSRKNAKEAGLDQVAPSQPKRQQLATKFENALTAKQFKEQLVAAATSPEEAEALYTLVEARAESAGESVDDYVGTRIKEVTTAPLEQSVYLKQRALRQQTGQPDALAQPAYHGSPYRFDKFTTDKIGEGEGAQAYGWGLYFAGEKEVARYYRDKLSDNKLPPIESLREYFTPGRIVPSFGGQDRVIGFNEHGDGRWSVTVQAVDQEGNDKPGERPRQHGTPPRQIAMRAAGVDPGVGALYQVDLKPTDEELLLWDKPFNEQSPTVQNALRSIGAVDEARLQRNDGSSIYDDLAASFSVADHGWGNQRRMASQEMQKAGIRGIKYLDGSSRGQGTGSHNYVIFDDADVAIEEVLAQKNRQNPRGEIQFIQDGRAIIRAFESQDVTTLAHEIGHLFRRDLKGPMLATAERWAGAKPGEKWSRAAEEKFARGFERYLRTGRAPNYKLRAVFQQFKDWLSNVYKAVRGTPLDVNFNKEMRAVYDSLFLPADAQTQADVTQETQNSVPPVGEPETLENPTIPETTSPQTAEFGPDRRPVETQTPDTLSQELFDRFRGLANQTTLPEGRAANYDVDVEMGFPERKAWADAEAAAAQRLAADPVGELQGFLEKIEQARASDGTIDLRDMTDAVVLNRLKDVAAQDINNPESRALHRTLHSAFREARTEQARSLGYRDPIANATPQERARRAITDAIAEPTPAEAEERKAAKTPEERAAVDMKADDRYEEAKRQLALEGIDLNDIEGIIHDKRKSMMVLDKFRPPSSKWDIAYEYWRNAILSGPRTHVTNVAGNALFSAWNLGPERAMEGAVNLFSKNPKDATFGEFKYLLGGVLPGLKRGLRNAITSWQLETSALSEELNRNGAFKVDGARGSTKGKIGRLIRSMGYRPLLAADEFAKSLTATMEVGARAYRFGKQRGLEGEQLQQFIQDQTDDLGSPSWTQAFSKAEELAFQGQKGLVSQGVASVGSKLRRIKGMRWVVPFVDTPAAIFEQGLKRTPVLGAILDYAESRKSGMNMVDAGMTPTLARQIIGLSTAALLWSVVDDEDPWITGAAVLKDKADRDLAYRTAPPQSIRIGDKWYSYAKIEPLATSLSWMVDTIGGMKRGEPGSAFLFGTAQQLKNKSYLDGLGDAMDVVEGVTSGDAGAAEEWVGKFAASWVPNLWRQTVSSLDGEIPETRVWGKENEHAIRVINRAAQSAQVPGVPETPRYDIWGRPIRYNDSWGHGLSDFAWSLLSPVKVKDMDTVTKADLALVRYNARNPNDKLVWSEPQKFVEVSGKTHYLTDEQYAEYAQVAGELAAKAVGSMRFSTENPTRGQVEAIGRRIGIARIAARRRLLPKWRKEWQ